MNARLAFLFASVAVASSALAAPPPPPEAGDLKSLQSYIDGLDQGRPELYGSALDADVRVIVDGKLAAQSKSGWMSSPFAGFNRGYNQNVTVEQVYYGAAASPDGAVANRAILVERADRIFGDCCVFHRVETLTFLNGLVARIDRSSELNLQLKSNGHRQDESPGTP